MVHQPRRAERTAPPVTEDMALDIIKMLEEGIPQHDIAAHFGLNQGRVSEINLGKRFPDLPRKKRRK